MSHKIFQKDTLSRSEDMKLLENFNKDIRKKQTDIYTRYLSDFILV